MVSPEFPQSFNPNAMLAWAQDRRANAGLGLAVLALAGGVSACGSGSPEVVQSCNGIVQVETDEVTCAAPNGTVLKIGYGSWSMGDKKDQGRVDHFKEDGGGDTDSGAPFNPKECPGDSHNAAGFKGLGVIAEAHRRKDPNGTEVSVIIVDSAKNPELDHKEACRAAEVSVRQR